MWDLDLHGRVAGIAWTHTATGAKGLTATRDGLYTAGYLEVKPVLQKLLTEPELSAPGPHCDSQMD